MTLPLELTRHLADMGRSFRVKAGGFVFVIAVLSACGQAPRNAIRVDCNDGESINRVITRSNLAQRLTISVTGTCVENVVIDRDHVRLNATPRASIVAARSEDPFPSAVAVLGATNVTIQGFASISGGFFAVLISNGSQADVRNNTLHAANQGLGIWGNSSAVVEDNWIHDNSTGILVIQSSSVVARRNRIDSNIDGVRVFDSSHGEFSDNEVGGNRARGVEANQGSSIRLSGDTITGNGTGVSVRWNSFALFWNDVTTIRDNSNYGIRCALNSSMNFLVAPDFTRFPANVPGNIENGGCIP